MKSLCSSVLIFIVIYNVSTIHADSVFKKYPQQKYNLVELVQDVALRISANKELKSSFDSPTATLHNDVKDISNRIFNPLLMDFLSNKTSAKCLEDLMYVFQNIASPGGWAAKSKCLFLFQVRCCRICYQTFKLNVLLCNVVQAYLMLESSIK